MNLISITLPESVSDIGEEAFWDCKALRGLSVPNLTVIKDYTFIGCESLTDIVIPQGVSAIGVDSFGYCYNLTSVTIPESVNYILHAAFWDCHSLKDIYYNGTTQQWNAIVKEVGEYSNTTTKTDASWNAYTGNYTVHCYDGQIEKD